MSLTRARSSSLFVLPTCCALCLQKLLTEGSLLAAVSHLQPVGLVAGVLLLAVPTCSQDTLFYPGHRMYGPERFQLLLAASRLTMIGRVWDGDIVEGRIGPESNYGLCCAGV